MDIENAVGNSIDTKLGSLIIIQFLGRGKSGYSYLAECAGAKYVVKLMHYEPCAHYSFGDSNKVDLEVSAYNVLKRVGINLPDLLDVNPEQNYLVKEYIDGDLITDLVINSKLPDISIEQVCQMAHKLKGSGLNIDYLPDNFVLNNNLLFYIDYEHNPVGALCFLGFLRSLRLWYNSA